MSEEIRGDSEYRDDKNAMNEEEKEYGNNRNDSGACESKEEAEEKNKEECEADAQGVQAHEESSCEEGRTGDEAETEACQEAGDNQEPNEAESPQISSEEKTGSYSYTPPRTSSGYSMSGTEGGKKAGKQKRRSFATVLIAVVVALAIALTAILPTLLMNVGLLAVNGFVGLGNIIDNFLDIRIESGNGQSSDGTTTTPEGGASGSMNVIKNDGSINVNEQVGSTGYSDTLSIAEVVELVADTVVEITTKSRVYDSWGRAYEVEGAGSGVIIAENGYIITNHHVIDGATSISVRLTSGSSFEGTLIGSDASKDIAVIKINATGLNFAKMGSSKDLVVGQEVVVIGNPLGTLGGTVTDGIISALDRPIVVDGYEMTLMQTNAAINSGNSGGGLFNRAGELVGVVNAKMVDEDIEGLGFAIPIDVAWETAKTIVDAAA